jgi:hypothetical protein
LTLQTHKQGARAVQEKYGGDAAVAIQIAIIPTPRSFYTHIAPFLLFTETGLSPSGERSKHQNSLA